MWTKRGLIGVAVLALAAAATADVYHVNPDCGDDGWSGLSPDCIAPDGPKATIQAAIDVAGDGDEVILAAGTYTGDGNRDVDFLGKAITVRSVDPDDPDVVDATVIDCQGSEEDRHRAFNLTSQEGPDAVLSGLTIVGGWAPLDCPMSPDWYVPFGSAVLCRASSPTITHCVMTNNRGATAGGAVFAEYGNPTITDCVFMDNEAYDHQSPFG